MRSVGLVPCTEGPYGLGDFPPQNVDKKLIHEPKNGRMSDIIVCQKNQNGGISSVYCRRRC